jgi:hypothetical protein
MEEVEQTKLSILTAGIHRETPLNISLNINNERQDCKIDTVHGRVFVPGGGVNVGD